MSMLPESSAALVDEHLLGDAVGLRLVLDEIDLKLLLEEIRHRALDEAVVDRLLGLVFVGGLRGKTVRHQNEAVLHVLELDGALVLLILADLLDVGVDGVDEGAARGLVRRAAVLQPGGVVVVLDPIDLV